MYGTVQYTSHPSTGDDVDSIDATGTDPAPGLADEAAPERNRDAALREATIELLAESATTA